MSDGGGGRRTKKARPDACTEFRGVNQRPSGKFGALIREFKGAAHSHRWIGTFDTAEDAARAYDAVAVEMHGSSAVTNFKQPAAFRVSPLLAESSGHGQGTHQQPSGGQYIVPQIGVSKAEAALSLVGFDDLKADLTPAEWQQVDELLKDMDSHRWQGGAGRSCCNSSADFARRHGGIGEPTQTTNRRTMFGGTRH